MGKLYAPSTRPDADGRIGAISLFGLDISSVGIVWLSSHSPLAIANALIFRFSHQATSLPA
jgi:hypothetical protein